MNRHEREEKFFSLLPLIQILEGTHHTYMKERESVFLGFFLLPPSLGKDAMKINGILLGKILLISGRFWLLVENTLLKRSKLKSKIVWVVGGFFENHENHLALTS